MTKKRSTYYTDTQLEFMDFILKKLTKDSKYMVQLDLSPFERKLAKEWLLKINHEQKFRGQDE